MMTTKIIGGKALYNRFKKMGDEGEKLFQEVVADTATYAHGKAVGYIGQNVNTGTGHLKQSMYVRFINKNLAEVGNRADYAGYVEFGTGKKVNVPPEFSAIASKVKSRPTKSFSQGLEAIRDWCKRLGIDVKAAYPIFMSILRDGVRPRPFLYPAYRDARRYMDREAQEAMRKLTKKK